MNAPAQSSRAIELSLAEARRFLAGYHFTPGDLRSIFDRLGTVQYDPLNPVGRNPDLVLQARVPNYRVDDWQNFAYGQRLAYDAWDKQACLVPIDEWSRRALSRRLYPPWHDSGILPNEADAVLATLAEIDDRGPLSSIDFSDRSHTSHHSGSSWLGPTRIKRILRALWSQGLLVTHHRTGSRHYYDRPERVIPPEHLLAEPCDEADDYHRWIVSRRYRAVGLLRPRSNVAIWSICGDVDTRARATDSLIESGDLVPIRVEGSKSLYYAPASALDAFSVPSEEPRVIFVAPLDSLLWDRKMISHIFGFEYAWEVYKPLDVRRWGYYVLPVWYGDRFVARVDSRLEGNVWRVARWWWESDVVVDRDCLDALAAAAKKFRRYLGATRVEVSADVERKVRGALRAR